MQTYLQMNKDWGDRVPIVVLRGGKPVKLALRLREKPKNLGD